MATVRGLIYGTLCVGLVAAGYFLLPFWRPYEAWERAVPAATWITAGLGAFGLCLSGMLAVLASRGRRVPPLLPLAAPLATTSLAAALWLVRSHAISGLGNGVEYREGLASLTESGLAALEVPAVALVWAALGFAGAALVGASAAPPAEGPAPHERLRWLAVLVGLAAAAAAVIALAGAVPGLDYALTDPRSLDLGPASVPVVPFLASPPGTRLGLGFLALLPFALLPCWVRLRELGAEDATRIAAARGLAVAGLVGGVVTAVIAGPLWPTVARAGYVVSTMGSDSPMALCSSPTAFSLPGAAAPFVLGGGLIVAALLALGLGRRLGRFLPEAGAVVIALVALLGARALSVQRIDAAAGGVCREDCTCAQAAAAAFTGRQLDLREQLDPAEAWCCCGLERIAIGSGDLPEVVGDPTIEPGTVIAVTDTALFVDDFRVVGLLEGRIDPMTRQGGDAGAVVLPLQYELAAASQNTRLIASRDPSQSFDGTAIVRMPAAARSGVLDAIIVTAPTAGFKQLRVVVRRPGVRDRCPNGALLVSGVWLASGRVDPQGARDEGQGYGSGGDDRRSDGLLPTEPSFEVPPGCARAALLSAPPIEGLCAGVYWSDGCVGVELAGDDRCGEEAREVEIWALRITDEGYALSPPQGDDVVGQTLEELSRQLLRRHEAAPARVRVVKLARSDDLPVERDLQVRAALIGRDGRRFAAAIPEELAGAAYPRGAPTSAGEAPVLTLETGPQEVGRSLSRETVRRYIRRHIALIRACYERALIQEPELAGRVAIRFTIAPSGEVSASTVESSTLASPQAERCIATNIRSIVFPEVESETVVTYPFQFATAEP